jgi:hypothetical protein
MDTYRRRMDTYGRKMNTYRRQMNTYRRQINRYERQMDTYRRCISMLWEAEGYICRQMETYGRQKETYRRQTDTYGRQMHTIRRDTADTAVCGTSLPSLCLQSTLLASGMKIQENYKSWSLFILDPFMRRTNIPYEY